MNIPLDRKLCRPTPGLAAPSMTDATVIAMGHSLSAIVFDGPAHPRARLAAQQDGHPVPRPFLALQLPLRSGGLRHVLLLGQGVDTVLACRIVLSLDGAPAAGIDPDWLQSPQADLSALTAQLSDVGRDRLLRAMLTTGASLFTGDAQAGLAEAILRLADLCDIPTAAPVARTQIAGQAIVSYAVPGGSGSRDLKDAVALENGHLLRLRPVRCLVEGKLLHVLFPPGLSPARILACPDTILRLAAPDAGTRRLPVADWLHGRGAACGDWLSGCLGRNGVASLCRSPAGDPVQTQLSLRHLSAGPAGLLYALVLSDPLHAVRRVVLERQGRRVDLTPGRGADGTAVAVGLADLGGLPRRGDTCRISVLCHSGPARLLAEAPVAAYDGGLPAGFEDAWTLGIDAAETLARARAGFHRPAPSAVIQHFGPTLACGLRIVTAIGDSADMIRARAATILAEGHAAPVEIVCTMTEGPLAVAARQAVAQTAAIYGIPHRLVLLPSLANAGERLHAALIQAQGVPALVMGADVLPDRQGWLRFWLRRLRRHKALAPALLAGDGSIAATPEGRDPCRGLPAAALPPSGRVAGRPLPGCLALGPAGIAQLLGRDAPHPDPAVWIAQALAGSARTETRFPFRRVGPAPAPGGFAAALADAEFALIAKVRP